MTSKDKTEDRAPREATLGRLLDRLKPGEAATVFRRLLKAHPDLSSEADEIARSLLRQLEYEDVVDSHDRAYLERDEVIPTARP